MSRALPSSLSPPPAWQVQPFGRLVNRSQASGQPHARPLSVFIDHGVVPPRGIEDDLAKASHENLQVLIVIAE